MDRKCPSELQRWDSPLWWRLLWTSSGTPAGRRAARPWSPWQQQTLTPPSTPLSEILSLAPHTASVMWTLSEGGTRTLSLSLSTAHTHLIPPPLPPLRLRLPDLLRSVDMLLLWCGVIKPKFGKVELHISVSWHETIRSEPPCQVELPVTTQIITTENYRRLGNHRRSPSIAADFIMGYLPLCYKQRSLVVSEHQLIHTEIQISLHLKLFFIAHYSAISGKISNFKSFGFQG